MRGLQPFQAQRPACASGAATPFVHPGLFSKHALIKFSGFAPQPAMPTAQLSQCSHRRVGWAQQEALQSTRLVACAASASPADAQQEAKYRVLLAMACKLVALELSASKGELPEDPISAWVQGPLGQLAKAKPELVSVPFLSWAADQEGAAPSGPHKQLLGDVCMRLVTLRDYEDEQGMELLYKETVAVLTAGAQEQQAALLAEGRAEAQGTNNTSSSSNKAGSSQEAGSADAAALASSTASSTGAQLEVVQDPQQYALQLAAAVTGQPVQLEGYGQVMDALIKLAPPAALTPEGITKGHEMAAELGTELRGRRQRSVASLLGRTKVSPEQADLLMAGTAAARILDMLLTLPIHEERVSLLPDCFTPPEPSPSAAGGSAAAGQAAEEETEELWCTPAQLLSEVDGRLGKIRGAGAQGTQPGGGAGGAGPAGVGTGASRFGAFGQEQQALAAPEGQLVGPELVAALEQLREHVYEHWVEGLKGKGQ